VNTALSHLFICINLLILVPTETLVKQKSRGSVLDFGSRCLSVGVVTVAGAVGQASGGDARVRVGAGTVAGASGLLRAVRVGARAGAAGRGDGARLAGVGVARRVVVGARDGVGVGVLFSTIARVGQHGRVDVVLARGREARQVAAAGMVHHHVVP
jgi:hypothetical protein